MKDKIQSKIIKLDDEIKEITAELAEVIQDNLLRAKTNKDLEIYRKLHEILKRLKEL
jgi:hypothetical protein